MGKADRRSVAAELDVIHTHRGRYREAMNIAEALGSVRCPNGGCGIAPARSARAVISGRVFVRAGERGQILEQTAKLRRPIGAQVFVDRALGLLP